MCKFFLFICCGIMIAGCGAENAAKEVCACYNEVYKLEEPAANKKMNDCISLLEKYRKQYKGTDDEKEFETAFHNCR